MHGFLTKTLTQFFLLCFFVKKSSLPYLVKYNFFCYFYNKKDVNNKNLSNFASEVRGEILIS